MTIYNTDDINNILDYYFNSYIKTNKCYYGYPKKYNINKLHIHRLNNNIYKNKINEKFIKYKMYSPSMKKESIERRIKFVKKWYKYNEHKKVQLIIRLQNQIIDVIPQNIKKNYILLKIIS